MAKVNKPCTVPGCQGRLEAGTRDKQLVEWCPVCERRIAQLKALHAKLAQLQEQREAPPASGPLTDEAILAVLPKRFATATRAARVTKRATNLVWAAIRRGEIRHANVASRIVLVSLASVKAWSETYQRRTPEGRRTLKIVDALPRTSQAAVSIEQLAAATKLSASNVSQWARKNAARPELGRRADIAKSGRPILRFWWQDPNAETPRA